MCPRAGNLLHVSLASVLALFAGLTAFAPAGATAAQGAGTGPNGPGELRSLRLALGNLDASSPSACTVAYTLQVQTENGVGNDAFELQVFDDGNLVQVAALSAPADGAVHSLSGTLRLLSPVSQVSPGVGVYLVDSGAILDFVDPVDIVCGVVEIPTLDTAGVWILTGLLLASALVVFRRSRRIV